MRFAAIDPGTLSMGVAIFDPPKLIPYRVELITVDRRERWDARIPVMIDQLRKILFKEMVEQIYCESPSHFMGSFKGQAAANSNSILKLSMLVGAIAGISVSNGISFSLVRVIDWKGQLPKPKVISRIKKFYKSFNRLYETKTFKNDMWDAVGIGLYTMGSF